uniref:Gustatory receptor n=1 Tax=Anopheles coluzzii TaxID=1518534 RepID=A0A6E8VYQ9_ANOCL
MECLQIMFQSLSALGMTLVRYDVRHRSYSKPTSFQFSVQLLYSLCCITFTSFRVWVQFSVHSQIEHEMLENISFIVSTASFCIIWMVVPLYAYARCSRLVHALNSLQANDAELGHVIMLSYRRVKCFACFIQLDGVLCCLLLSTGYTIAFWYQGQPWYIFLNIGIYIYEDLCLSWLFGIYSAIMLFCVAQLSCAAKLLQSDYYHSDTLETRLRLFCRTYDRVCTRVAQPFYEYCGPVVATFCPLLIFEGSLKLFHAYDVFKSSTYRTVWTEQLLSASEWLWLSFDVKKLFVVLYVSEVLKQKVEETALCTRHFDDYRLQNTRAAKQIQKFLLKNLHQKKKFSACGFFDIDNTVIYMVFSSIVTYLVILIQFKQLETDLTQAGDGYNVTSNVSTVQP